MWGWRCPCRRYPARCHALLQRWKCCCRCWRLVFRVRALLQFAYNVQDFLVSGGPGWMGSDRFDVDAKADGPLTVEQGRVLVQGMLEERFQLKVRRETATKPIYALVIGKKGPKLTLSEDQTPPVLGPPVAGLRGVTACRGARPGLCRGSSIRLRDRSARWRRR